MSGVVRPNNDFLVKFLALAAVVPLRETEAPLTPINPSEGDTGTGTGTQTL